MTKEFTLTFESVQKAVCQHFRTAQTLSFSAKMKQKWHCLAITISAKYGGKRMKNTTLNLMNTFPAVMAASCFKGIFLEKELVHWYL